MTDKFVIAKWSRSPGSVSYSGPTCERAGVTPGRVYDDRAEAQRDADALSKANPVGFLVYEVKGTTA